MIETTTRRDTDLKKVEKPVFPRLEGYYPTGETSTDHPLSFRFLVLKTSPKSGVVVMNNEVEPPAWRTVGHHSNSWLAAGVLEDKVGYFTPLDPSIIVELRNEE